MRLLSLTSLLLLAAISNAMPQNHAAGSPQQGPAPRQRPASRPTSSRFRSMINDVMGEMTGVYDRVRNGFTRTFSGAQTRLNGFRNVGGSQIARNPVDPAVHTNEIAPARNSEGAPNAPNTQGFRRPNQNRRPSNFMKRVEQIFGSMRNMFQSFNRRMSNAVRRQQTPQIVPQHQVGGHQQQHQAASAVGAGEQHHQQTGEFKPLH